jgi:hypothetical protein
MWSTRYQELKEVQYSPHILKNTQISNFMKIRPVGAEMFHAETETYS